ncbi:MAG: hypothetical protein K0S98_960 [Propionibacteriaceae bacterium]|nr:hypothetical protein [Propionibacteriaceae bacterium]MDF2968129.1 hypothetical protein [Nocardioidaceae bacterium]
MSPARARAWGDAHPRLRLGLTIGVSLLAGLLVMAFLSSTGFDPSGRAGFFVTLAFGVTLIVWTWHKGPKPGVEPHALTALQIGMVVLLILMAVLEFS